MKIGNVRLVTLKHMYSERYSWPGARALGARAMIVEVVSDAGLSGLGEIGVGTPQMCRPIVERLGKLIIGQNAQNIEQLWMLMYRHLLPWGRRSLSASVLGALDIALWDLKGKALKVPVYQLAGGARRKLTAYASGGQEQSLESLAAEMQHYVDAGYKAVKIRIGYPEPARNEDIVKTARQALGADIELMVDAGQRYVPTPWTMHQAIRIGRMLEKYDVAWLEEPWRTDDLAGYAYLTQALEIPVAGGENGTTRWDFLAIAEARAMDVIQPDVTIAGGITECKKIAVIADAHAIRCVPHTWVSGIGLMASLHFAASCPNTSLVEYAQVSNPIAHDLMRAAPVFADGALTLSDAPGLGVQLSEEIIAKYPDDGEDVYEFQDSS